eukprot:TRINITY_DN5006_c1_g1_i1.p1 TRINITY_DN5006_c1_g1~~TRINITY_DN5006_c1_g1_i1.p1  ORF type:complete len:364 (+),score=96.90 TRINITY_DN5006_c1_g1_i1:107-1198(+)
MSMFAASLNTLKQRTSQLLKGDEAEKLAGFVQERKQLDFGPQAAEALGCPDDSLLVQYEVQNSEEDRELAVFMLPLDGQPSVTGAMVRASFPLPGRYHFRFKAPTSDGSFGGFVWIDLATDLDLVPVYYGNICLKALYIPGEASQRTGSSVPPSAAAPAATTRQAPSNSGYASAQAAPAAQRSAAPPSDLMGFDMGAPASRAPGQPQFNPSASSTPQPPPKPVVFDRDKLVAEREAKEKKAVEDKMKSHKEQIEREAREKQEKVDHGNKLQKEMDDWAKLPTGEAYKDIRTLLSTLHTVIWKGSGWEPLPLSELVAGPGKVKSFYRKAILLAHPDRHQGAEIEQQVRADRIFNALNEAFKAGT